MNVEMENRLFSSSSHNEWQNEPLHLIADDAGGSNLKACFCVRGDARSEKGRMMATVRWRIAAGAMAGIAGLALGACDADLPNNRATSVEATSTATPVSADGKEIAKQETVNARARQLPEASLAAPSSEDPVLAVEGEGLRLFNAKTTSATPIPFGRPQAEVLATLERVRGSAGKGVNKDCGAGPVEYANWPDGLSLVFQRNRFVGWGLDARAAGALSTASSVGPGSTRKQLETAYADVRVSRTSLGEEFNAGGFSGLIDGSKSSSKITDMWAGISCVAR